MNWFDMSEKIRNDRAVFDLYQEFEKYVKQPLKSEDHGFKQ